MKNRLLNKWLSLVLSVALIAGFLPVYTVNFAPKAKAYGTYSKNYTNEYNYASGTTYIAGVCVGYDGSSLSTIGSQIVNAGWTKCSNFIDMMAGWGSKADYIGIGYKTTTNPADALTGILFWDSDDGDGNHNGVEGGQVGWSGNTKGICDGIQYYRAGASPLLSYRDGTVDFFRGFGSGYGTEYLCATTDRGAGLPITTVNCFTSMDSSYIGVACIEKIHNSTNNWHRANHGKNGNNRYVGYKRGTFTAVDTSTLRSKYTTALGRYNETSYSDKYTSASRTALQNALSTGDSILSDVNDGYTTYTQTQITNAATALQNAVNGLTLNTYTVTFTGYTSGTTTGTLKTQNGVAWGTAATAPTVATTYDDTYHYHHTGSYS